MSHACRVPETANRIVCVPQWKLAKKSNRKDYAVCVGTNNLSAFCFCVSVCMNVFILETTKARVSKFCNHTHIDLKLILEFFHAHFRPCKL